MERLPAWVEAAIESQDAAELRSRLVRRWSEIRLDVLPALAGLSDIEKQSVFDAALWVGRYWQRDATARHRKAIAHAKFLRERIASAARDLAGLLSKLNKLAEENDLVATVPAPWELLEATAPDYPEWFCVMEDHGHWHEFIEIASYQGRPAPKMADLLQVFAANIDSGDGVWSQVQTPLNSRKGNAGPVRILITHLNDRSQCHRFSRFSQTFRLPDKAIATLAGVLFDMDESPDVETIKMMRARMKGR